MHWGEWGISPEGVCRGGYLQRVFGIGDNQRNFLNMSWDGGTLFNKIRVPKQRGGGQRDRGPEDGTMVRGYEVASSKGVMHGVYLWSNGGDGATVAGGLGVRDPVDAISSPQKTYAAERLRALRDCRVSDPRWEIADVVTTYLKSHRTRVQSLFEQNNTQNPTSTTLNTGHRGGSASPFWRAWGTRRQEGAS